MRNIRPSGSPAVAARNLRAWAALAGLGTVVEGGHDVAERQRALNVDQDRPAHRVEPPGAADRRQTTNTSHPPLSLARHPISTRASSNGPSLPVSNELCAADL